MAVQILLSTAFLLLFLYGVFRIPAGAPKLHVRTGSSIAFFSVLLALGLVLRLVLGYAINGFDADIACFKAWAYYTHEIGFNNMYYSDFFLDYPPGYLYMLYIVEFFRRLFSIPDYSQTYTLLIKLIPILSDIGCTAILWTLARRLISENAALFTAAAYLFCPAVIINSAVWGQADSFCALLLLLTVLLLWHDRIPAAALLYGLGVLSKPQMLIFAPVLIFWVIRKKKWIHLLLGPVLAVGVILLLSTPFLQNFDYMKLIELYTGTMDYYAYYTINAYNIWALFGLNWGHLPENSTLLQFGVPVATALAGVLMLKSKRDDAVFACPTVLMFTVYMLCIKMHERYLFPVLLSMLLTYAFTKEKRFLFCFAGTSAVHFLNVAYILHLNNAYISPTAPEILLLSLAHVVMYLYTLYCTWYTFIAGKAAQDVRQAKHVGRRFETPVLSGAPAENRIAGRRITAVDLILVCGITLIYALFAFTNLGDTKTANTTWTPKNGESAVFFTEEYYGEIFFLPGIAPADNGIGQRTGKTMLVEVSDDMNEWRTAAEISDGSVYAWNTAPVMEIGQYIRITSMCDDLAINEFALKHVSGNGFVTLHAVAGHAPQLTDEQNTVPLYPSYMNSTYFDEIYHARTAYEHILKLEPYENTHPTLGKLIISLGIRMFGMNPFGWRFMGTLFGVLMLPILYHLLKRLFASTLLSAAGTFLFAFDFMHYVQTRISTIDTYAVFFLLLMYDAMIVFLQRDLTKDSFKRLLTPLFLCGLFMGLGVASKWTVAYGAVGLAVLYFGKLLVTYSSLKGSDEKQLFLGTAVSLCLWCCLFFVLIPFAIYFTAFLPITTLPHNSYDVVGRFFAYQKHMFNYHSNLDATHSFQSAWYQWPFDIRNVWYYGNFDADGMRGLSTISVLGSPLLWWSTVPAMLFTLWAAVKKRVLPALVAAVGYLAVILPWVPISRCTFIYHYFTAIPFLMIAWLFAFENLCALPALKKPLLSGNIRNTAVSVSGAHVLLAAFLLVHFVLFLVFYPVLTGTVTTQDYANALEWLPTWFFA